MNCKEASRFIASGDQENAPWFKRLAWRLHVSMCKKCSRYAAEIRAIGEAARRTAGAKPQDSDTADLEKRLLNHIRKD